MSPYVKIQAYMPCFNEADILPHALCHLHEQGCAVHLIDGWSTDGSVDIAFREGATCEYFPLLEPSSTQVCTQILQRIEDLAAESDADWILYTDADEWRNSNVAGETLAEGIQRVEYFNQYNAIDFSVYQFYPTTDTVSWDEWRRVGPEKFFRYYDQADCISRIPNRKLWKNVGRVKLAGGGHEVQFRGMNVYPQKFIMKHYPFRTPAQAKSKIETRLARRCKEEHDRGWGVHYDQYPADFSYCWDAAKLLRWEY